MEDPQMVEVSVEMVGVLEWVETQDHRTVEDMDQMLAMEETNTEEVGWMFNKQAIWNKTQIMEEDIEEIMVMMMTTTSEPIIE